MSAETEKAAGDLGRKIGEEIKAELDKEREPIMRFFEWRHLPGSLQWVSAPFAKLAEEVHRLPRNAERSTALRKLLEAKDAAVRAAIP